MKNTSSDWTKNKMQFPLKKIRHRMMAVIILSSLLPVFLLGMFVFFRTREELSGKALEMQKSVAEAVRQGLIAQVNLYAKQLEKFVQEIDIQGMNQEAQVTALYRFLDLNPLFFSIFIYDTEGRIVSLGYRNRFKGDDFLLGRNIFEAKEDKNRQTASIIKEVIKTGRMIVSDKIVSFHQIKQLLVMDPVPAFENPHKFIGAMSCGIQIDGPSLQGTIENFKFPGESFMLLTDGDGTILAKKGKTLPEGLETMKISRPVSETEFESTWTNLNGSEIFLTFGRIPAIGTIIAIGTPRNEIFGFIHQIIWGMFLLTLISLVIGLFFSLILSDNMVEPILDLIEGIKKVSEGAVSHRVNTRGEDELSDAGRAFNEMASHLEKNRLMEDIWSRKWKPPS